MSALLIALSFTAAPLDVFQRVSRHEIGLAGYGFQPDPGPTPEPDGPDCGPDRPDGPDAGPTPEPDGPERPTPEPEPDY